MLALTLVDQIHSQAKAAASRYQVAEAQLLDVLIQVEQHRVFIRKGYPSLYSYVVNELGLSEGAAYSLITVSRKARQLPELKARIQSGVISISNAKRISPILTDGNQVEWLKKASELTSRELEKEIFKVRPEIATPERIKYVGSSRVKLELGLSEENRLRLKRVQDILSHNQNRAVTLEETLIAMTCEYLFRHDPLEKAKRQSAKVVAAPLKQEQKEQKDAKIAQSSQMPRDLQDFRREAIPRQVLHQVNLRDERQCTSILPNGLRCNQTRWLQIHHKLPVSLGGPSTLDNLITLCSAHHDDWHFQERGG